MAKFAVIKTGGKQYLVKENDEIVVDKLEGKQKDKLDLPTLAQFDSEKNSITLGSPDLKVKAKVELVEQLRGDKIKVSRFKAKVRYRRTKGFRSSLSKIKVLTF